MDATTCGNYVTARKVLRSWAVNKKLDFGYARRDYDQAIEFTFISNDLKWSVTRLVNIHEFDDGRNLYPVVERIIAGVEHEFDKIARERSRRVIDMDIPSMYPETHMNREFIEYCKADVEATKRMSKFFDPDKTPEIKDVIFNYPATIVLWTDGTKTVVQAQEDDVYDPEKGLAMAICKKIGGNKWSYYNKFKHWLKKAKKED